jgi:peptidoglycan/LPS O-acetylase OafA/YrhL
VDGWRLGYRRELDGVRGAACLAVVVAHTMPGPFVLAGAVGVSVFFTLSGFLITCLLLEERDRTGSIGLGGFYARRARRLLPALALIVVVVRLAPGSALGEWDGLGLASILTYWSNYAEINGVYIHPFSHLWSLAVEEHFYLLWPALLLAFRFRVAPLAIAMTATSLAWSYWLLGSGVGLRHVYVDTGSRICGVAVGCLLAVAVRQGARVPAWVVPLSALVLVWFCTQPMSVFLWWQPVVLLASVGLLAGAVGGGAGVLALGPLVLVGQLSYGIYLWHFVVIVQVGTLGALTAVETVEALLITAVVVWTSWRLVEQPLRSRRSGHRPVTQPALLDTSPVG